MIFVSIEKNEGKRHNRKTKYSIEERILISKPQKL